ncbi:MAG: FGGY family carbohydrate kinase, partial [Sphaerochaetaceae bacterium]
MRVFAGIDNGTQSTKVLVYDADEKRVLALVQAPHELISRSDGSREQLASWWVEALSSCFAQIDP